MEHAALRRTPLSHSFHAAPSVADARAGVEAASTRTRRRRARKRFGLRSIRARSTRRGLARSGRRSKACIQRRWRCMVGGARAAVHLECRARRARGCTRRISIGVGFDRLAQAALGRSDSEATTCRAGRAGSACRQPPQFCYCAVCARRHLGVRRAERMGDALLRCPWPSCAPTHLR
jgi:hypothetical protein